MKNKRLAIFWLLLLAGIVASCDSNNAYKPRGRLLYETIHGGNLIILDLEEDTRVNVGEKIIRADFSPDGSKIVFIQDEEGNNRSLAIMDDNGGNEYILVDKTNVNFPRWSPDGEMIVFDSGYDINIIDMLSGEITKVTDDAHQNLSPVWAPDSRQVAFARNFFEQGENLPDIYVWDREDNSIERITENIANNYPLSWSPDGKELVIASSIELGGFQLRLYILDLESGETRHLIDDQEISSGTQESEAVWSPDGKWIAVDVDGKICIVDRNGDLYDCYTEGYEYRLLDWGP